MNSVLEEIYSTIMPAAPYVVIAYASVWLILLVYVIIVTVGFKKTERQMTILEEALEEKGTATKS